MDETRTIVVLTDGESNLAHYMDMLRRDGWRVLATSRRYEAALWVARSGVHSLIARSRLIPDGNGDFLRQLRDFHPRPLTIVTHGGDEEPHQPPPLVDLFLPEPFSYEELLDSLDFGGPNGKNGATLTVDDPEAEPDIELEVAPPEEAAKASRASLPKIYQVVNASRTLSELERDREQLLTTALELFMEVTDSERGSIMLKTDDGEGLQVVRRQGFPADASGPIVIRPGDEIAGAVLNEDEPLLCENVDDDYPDRPRRGYSGSSFLIVPLTSRQSTLGVVNLTNHRGGESYVREDLIHAMMLADQTAVTLSNAHTLNDLHAMTVVDPLTKLFNRRHFDRELKKEIERAKRYGRQLTLALMDIDNFKVFNDMNGYVTGDAILKTVGGIIRSCFREVDIVTRWGGDEFAVLLPETGRPLDNPQVTRGPKSFIERVRRAVEKADFSDVNPQLNGHITLSIGVATFPGDGGSGAELFRVANAALKKAKRMGANHTCFADRDEAASA